VIFVSTSEVRGGIVLPAHSIGSVTAQAQKKLNEENKSL